MTQSGRLVRIEDIEKSTELLIKFGDELKGATVDRTVLSEDEKILIVQARIDLTRVADFECQIMDGGEIVEMPEDVTILFPEC